MSPTATIHRSECEALPKGWIREEVPRVGNVSNKVSDVYYISPMGKRIRSKQELVRMIGDVYDLKAFDYFSGKINPALVRAKPASRRATGERRRRPAAKSTYDFTKNLTADLESPARQTANIFARPVTIQKRHYNSDVRREDLDAEIYLEKPRQLFWEKRLVGLKPSFDDDNFHPLQMSNIFKAVGQNALISQLESKKTLNGQHSASESPSSAIDPSSISNVSEIIVD